MSKKKSTLLTRDSECPCQSGLLFQQCCKPFLDTSSSRLPATAEQLMRSRYCAYVLADVDYLLKTWHPDHRPDRHHLNISDNHWIGLKIKSSQSGQANDSSGTVHFIARFKVNGKAQKLEENSLFKKMNGRWLYIKEAIS